MPKMPWKTVQKPLLICKSRRSTFSMADSMRVRRTSDTPAGVRAPWKLDGSGVFAFVVDGISGFEFTGSLSGTGAQLVQNSAAAPVKIIPIPNLLFMVCVLQLPRETKAGGRGSDDERLSFPWPFHDLQYPT